MIDLSIFKKQKAMVLGMGASGFATARALIEGDVKVVVWDDDAEKRKKAQIEGFALENPATCDFTKFDFLVPAPGIPFSPNPHPAITKATDSNCKVVGDIEILSQAEKGAHLIGITGTNGKSTTTALVGHILSAARDNVAIGGNLGMPALSLKGTDPGDRGKGWFVLELSSYQLDLIRTATFDIAALLNITPDHLTRHGGLDGYIAAKKRIFKNQNGRHSAVIGMDDPHCRKIHDELKARDNVFVIPVSAQEKVDGGVYMDGRMLVNDIEGRAENILDLDDALALPGAHNGQNAVAAFAICRAAGLSAPEIAGHMKSFPGLAHRQEMVAHVRHVSFINDSKATNSDATAKALECYRNIYWIAGGRAKESGIDSLAPWFDRVRHAYLIGEAADDFAETLAGAVGFTLSGDLETAVRQAARMAFAADVNGTDSIVLLSPACASFDQWENFESRGDAFRELVIDIINDQGNGNSHSVGRMAS